MLLNLHILKEDLSDLHPDSYITEELYSRRLAFPVVYRQETSPEGNRLYIASAANLPSEMDFHSNPSFLCIGTPPDIYLEGKCNILVFPDQVQPGSLISRTSELFFFYQDWELQLQTSIANEEPLEKLGNLSEPVFQNPLTFADSNMRVIFFAASKKRYQLSPILTEFLNSIRSPDSSVFEDLQLDRDFVEAGYKSGVQLFPLEKDSIQMLYRNIFLDDRKSFSCRLMVDEQFRKFTAKDYVLLEFLAEIITEAIRNKENLIFNRPRYYDEVLTDLLEHRFLPEKKIHNILREMGWKVNDRFFCIVIPHTDYDPGGHTLGWLAPALACKWPNSCYIIHKQNIVFIFNLSLMEMSKTDSLHEILPVLRDANLKAGISTDFSDFKELYYYYNSCIHAIQLGRKKNPAYWYYRFEDYTLDYIKSRIINETRPQVLYPHGLLALSEHDRKHGTSYMEILKVYLECGLSPLKTSEKLYIHRNTLIYRLSRIREILKMDLENPDVRLLLQVILSL